MASSVAPLTAVKNQGFINAGPEQPRDFHFAVTWVTLFAHLDPIEATCLRHRPENPSPSLALVPIVASAPLVEQPWDQDSSDAWEMVVPKMIRTGTRTFIPAEGAERSGQMPEFL